MQTSKVIGVVLAGGRSSRMGKDKALLQLDASTMIMRTEKLLRATSADKVVISRNDGGSAHYADLIPNKGPLSGIHSIATRFPTHNLVVLPVDLPLMDAQTIELLIECARVQSKNVRFKGENLPLFIQNTPAFRQVIDNTLRCTKHFSVEKLCSHFPIVELPNTVQSKMFNTNTPEQWGFAMQHFHTTYKKGTQEVHHESF